MSIPHDDGKEKRAAILSALKFEVPERLNLFPAPFGHEWLLSGIVDRCPAGGKRIYGRRAKGDDKPPSDTGITIN